MPPFALLHSFALDLPPHRRPAPCTSLWARFLTDPPYLRRHTPSPDGRRFPPTVTLFRGRTYVLLPRPPAAALVLPPASPSHPATSAALAYPGTTPPTKASQPLILTAPHSAAAKPRPWAPPITPPTGDFLLRKGHRDKRLRRRRLGPCLHRPERTDCPSRGSGGHRDKLCAIARAKRSVSVGASDCADVRWREPPQGVVKALGARVFATAVLDPQRRNKKYDNDIKNDHDQLRDESSLDKTYIISWGF